MGKWDDYMKTYGKEEYDLPPDMISHQTGGTTECLPDCPACEVERNK